jgi:hypothetical protein
VPPFSMKEIFMTGELEARMRRIEEGLARVEERTELHNQHILQSLVRIEDKLEDGGDRFKAIEDEQESLGLRVAAAEGHLHTLGKVTTWGGGLLSATIMLALNKLTGFIDFK